MFSLEVEIAQVVIEANLLPGICHMTELAAFLADEFIDFTPVRVIVTDKASHRFEFELIADRLVRRHGPGVAGNAGNSAVSPLQRIASLIVLAHEKSGGSIARHSLAFFTGSARWPLGKCAFVEIGVTVETGGEF